MDSGTHMAMWRVWWPTAATLGALALGSAFVLVGRQEAADVVWGVSIAAVAVSLAVEIVQQIRARRPGVDVIALLAMVGAVLLGEYLAGAIIAVMLTTGRSLEDQADARARRELTALIAAAPRTASRRVGERLEEIAVGEVVVGDLLLVKPGTTVPVDGALASDRAVLDESSLTGEARPVERERGDRVSSGAVNAGGAFELRATATEADSTYRGLIHLVELAQAERAPFVRLADRVALWFVPFTLVVAGAAWWVSGDPVRVLAVLVVATPCPLILATPIAITSGMSRMARRGMIVKGGGALEALARAEIVLLDKTGTVTSGHPRVLDVETFGGTESDEVIRLAASLEQASVHVFAPSIVAHARDRGLTTSFPTQVHETAGQGIEGLVDGRPVRVGRSSWIADGTLPAGADAIRRRTDVEGSSAVYVAVDGQPVGAVLLVDTLRPEAVRTVRGLRRGGIREVVLVTGDRAEVAELIGSAVDVDRVLAERRPEDKVHAVTEASSRGVTVMVGDGVNDAPALAHADVGIAMGGQGATASSEAADVVVLVDRFDRIEEAFAVARRTRRIAWQSIQVGMGLAVVAMTFAALGWLTPVVGAVVQEAIDVVAILLALRALRSGRTARARPELGELSTQLRHRHRELQVGIDQLRIVADSLDLVAPSESGAAVREVARFVRDDLIPHELAEEHDVYPLLAISDEDPTGPLRHTHREIVRLGRLLDEATGAIEGPPEPGQRTELRRLLYGLHAVITLHNAQEEEAYGLLDQAADPVRT
ncbi:MAG TPA: heavy metal translocating P-type ATPase [Egicoccus sp.]|nr:heavy metal translocating P-type ATPase [Egicoccus sp.]HSK24624.1 heavy metal translocating P-type ATPase [Egicoccus sp.]